MRQKRNEIIIIITVFLLSNLLTNTVYSLQTTYPNHILYVGGSGPGNYTSIQSAIDNSTNGDIIYIYYRTISYKETLTIPTSITLLAENKNVRLQSNDNDAITISAAHVSIINLKIIGSILGIKIINDYITLKHLTIDVQSRGIEIYGSSTTITNCTINSKWPCIDIHPNTHNISINKNNLKAIQNSISISDSTNINISENMIECENDCIRAWNISYSIIQKNNIKLTKDGYSGIMLFQAHHTEVQDNLLTSDTTASNSNGIWLQVQCYNNQIRNNSIYNMNQIGLAIIDSFDNTITNNDFNNNTNSILLRHQSHHNTIKYNTIQNSRFGIKIEYLSPINTIHQNSFTNNEIPATFSQTLYNNWDNNYWQKPRNRPYIIIGSLIGKIPNFINIDWHPATTPHQTTK